MPFKHARFIGIPLLAFVCFFIGAVSANPAASQSNSWSKYKEVVPVQLPDSAYSNVQALPSGPKAQLQPLDAYMPQPGEDPLLTALKADDMIASFEHPLEKLDTQGRIAGNGQPEYFMQQADTLTAKAGLMYQSIHQAYTRLNAMKGQVKSNFDTFNTSAKEQEDSDKLNAQSDAMAREAGSMKSAVSGMARQMENGKDLFREFNNSLDEMAQNGRETQEYYTKFTSHIREAASQFEGMAAQLKSEGLDAPNAFNKARNYFSAMENYVAARKPFTQKEMDYVGQVKNYLRKNQDYLNRVSNDFENTKNNLNDWENYFRKAKVHPSKPLQLGNPGGGEPSACSALKSDDPNAGKGRPLMSQDACQKSCHTVCRQEKKAGSQWCYACPSGSPDTCYAHGGMPAGKGWCGPDGICTQNPELYCQDFGAIGQNGEHLNCTACKQADDDCWEKVGNDTTNLTHCVEYCNDGVCTYKGKYKLSDNPAKYMHCYQCKKPSAPTCESLGWGSSTLEMCTKNCPDGDCKGTKITVGPDGKAHADNPNGPGQGPGAGGGNNGGDNGGGCGGGQCGGGNNGGQGGTTTGGTGGGDQGNQPNPPPTDKPLGGDTGGGASTTAGGGGKTTGEQPKPTEGANKPAGDNKPQNPPAQPQANEPKQPQPPTQEKPKPPENPTTTPPDPWEVNFYQGLINDVNERIKKYEGLSTNADYQGVKTMVKSTLDDLNKEKQDLEKKLKDAQDKFNTQQKDYEATKKYFDDYEKWQKSQPKKLSYAEEAKLRGQAYNMGKLKEATENLKTIVKEAKDSAENRKKHIDDLTAEIDRLKNENENLSDTVTRGREGSEEAKQRTEDNNKRIEQLTQDRAYFIREFKKSQERYKEQIDKAMSDYRTALFRTSEAARRKVEVQRIDEYTALTQELKHREQVQAERNKVIDTIEKNLESARQEALNKGDTTTADNLKEQEDNLKREQDKWNQMQDKQQENLKEQIYQAGQRNFNEGAGPFNDQSLNEQLSKYSKILQDALNDPNLTADQKAALQATLDGIKDKQTAMTSTDLSAEDKQNIDQTTMKIANSAMSQGADPSLLKLFGESLVEEAVNNLNPLTAAKKSLAFGWGVVQGVGSVVKGAVELGAGATKLIVQSAASDLGLEGTFGTDAVDTLSNVLTTGYNNANPEGLLKAVMAAGAAQDKWLSDMQKGDIDWNTANAGGKVVGNIVGGELLAPGKAGELLTEAKAFVAGEEVAANAANTLAKTQEVANAAAKAEETANAAAKTEETAATITNPPPDESPTVINPPPNENPTVAGGNIREAPTEVSPPSQTAIEPPPNQGGTLEKTAIEPPPQPANGGSTPTGPPKVGPNSEVSFKTPDGQTVEVKTGKQLGKGSTSTAYVDATDPNKVVRVTTPSENSPEAFKLDNYGRRVVEYVEKPDGPIRIVKKYESYTVTDPQSPLNGKIVEINERAANGSANGMIKAQGGTMTQGQAEAFDKAMRELNQNGYAWMDNHSGNYGFEKVPGGDDKWRVVVIDPGGIVPMKGATIAERAESATALQTAIDVPPDAEVKMFQNAGPDLKRYMAMGRQQEIMEQFADKIDAAAIGLDGPNKIAWYSYGTIEHPNVQALAKMSPEQASAYYAGK